MKYLLFVSLLPLLNAFSPEARQTQRKNVDDCFNLAAPKFSSHLYDASIDVTGHHISGLLFLKTMADSSQRAVFSSETGITYFDFEWNTQGDFKTHHVIKKLRKKIVLNTLRKDFELIVIPVSIKNKVIRSGGSELEFSVTRGKERLKFKASGQCESIKTVEVIGKKNKLVDVNFFPQGKNVPDSISVIHHNFNMRIGLKKIER